MNNLSRNISNANFTKIQNLAYALIRNDLRFIYTIMVNINITTPSYLISMLPYLGLIVDGAEDWIKAYNNSSKSQLPIPTFTQIEQDYYEKMRASIKLFEKDFCELNKLLKEKYEESEYYFSSVCKPFAKRYHLYDIYGVFTCQNEFCDNTILNQINMPYFNFYTNDDSLIKKMAEICGKYAVCFKAMEAYCVDTKFVFDSRDYGGMVKSPIGNIYSSKFVLLSMLCQINFLLFCVDKFIKSEISTKLRFAYILYYYILKILPEINVRLKTKFKLDDKYKSDLFRNAMAHYKLGIVLDESDIIDNDIMFGLTQKFFGKNYLTVKNEIFLQLFNLSLEIKLYLNIK